MCPDSKLFWDVFIAKLCVLFQLSLNSNCDIKYSAKNNTLYITTE